MSAGRRMRGSVKRLFARLLTVCLLGYLLVTYVIQRVDVHGDSMEPTLCSGDVLLVDKLTPNISGYNRYDVVVFRYRYREEQYYIKRIIGLPGETVQIAEGNVWIDGVKLEDDFGVEPIEKAKRAIEPVVLGDGEYFVLGDNRNHSSDSRDSDIGNLTKADMIGKAVWRIWPLSQIGSLGDEKRTCP